MKSRLQKNSAGFSLIELLVVIAIIAILTTLGVTSFSEAQKRGRDTQRKSDLQSLKGALEQYYSDHNAYPDSQADKIKCLPPDTSAAKTWGVDPFECDSKTYFGDLPRDPMGINEYVYVTSLCGSGCQRYFLWAKLENTNDPAINDSNTLCAPTRPGDYNYCVYPVQ